MTTPTTDTPLTPTAAAPTASPDTSGSQPAIGPPTVRLVNDSVAPGDLVVVAATFTNNGTTTQSVDAVFQVFDEPVDRKQVQVQARASATVRFERRIGEPGRYRFAVNGGTATIDVPGERATATESDSTGPGADMVMVAVVLLAGGAVLLIRQL